MGERIKLGTLFLPILAGIFLLVKPASLLPQKEQADAALIERHLVDINQRLESYQLDLTEPEDLSTHLNYLIYEEQKLIFWQNNLVFPPASLRNLMVQNPEQYYIYESPNGKFICWQVKKEAGKTHFGMAQILAPYLLENGNTVWALSPELGGSPDYQYEFAKQGTEIESDSGQLITRLKLNSKVVHGSIWYVLLLIFLILLFLISSQLFQLELLSFGKKSFWLELGIETLILIAVYWIVNGFAQELYSTAPFAPSEKTAAFLGRLTTGTILLTTWSMVAGQWWHKIRLPRNNWPGRILPYLGLIWTLFALIKLIETLVFESGIDFYYSDVFHVLPGAWIALGMLILLQMAAFLWNTRWQQALVQREPNATNRAIGFLIALTSMLPAYALFGAYVPLPIFCISAFAISILLDQFVETRQRDLTWLIVWLMVFSGFASMLIYSLQNKKASNIEQQIAETLQLPVDPEVAQFVNDLSNQPEQAASSWRLKWNSRPYLSAYYDIHLAEDSLATNSGLFQTDHDWNYSFIPEAGTRLQMNLKEGDNNLWAFQPLNPPAFRGLEALDRFSYAVYDGNKKVLESREVVFPETPPTGNVTEAYKTLGRFSRFDFEEGKTVLLQYRERTLIKPISLFSFLFTLLFLLAPLFALLNNWLKFLPKDLDVSWSAQSSLGNKIQISVLALIVISFLFIGGVTVVYFQRTELAEVMDQNRQRLDAVLAELKEVWDSGQPDASQLNRIAKSHRQEIRLYQPEGDLFLTTDGLAYRLGLSPSKVDWKALGEVAEGGTGYIIRNERIAAQDYQVVYRASRNEEDQLRAVYGFPLGIATAAAQSKVAGFLGALLNVYVFLLLIAGAVSIAVASSITRPLTYLRTSLAQVKLGKNEPIPYQKADELGVLISEYNQMLEKLEEATRKLSQTERESAWRQMAKQVAHEIKNPLTPMQLSIQHLQRVLKTDPESAGPLIQRTASTLVNQIETLSGIASAFSSFARMPQAELQELDVAEMIRSAHILFEKERSDIDFELEIQPGNRKVLADKGQILRVFNNLYKNAIQAIPEGRKGIIKGYVLQADEQHLQVKICDNGTGIPEASRGKVFIPNFTTKSSGSGLGLAMAKNIVRSFGGQIYFETETDKGTCFFVELPLLLENS